MDRWSTAPEVEPVKSKPVNLVQPLKPVNTKTDSLTVIAQDLEVRPELWQIKTFILFIKLKQFKTKVPPIKPEQKHLNQIFFVISVNKVYLR